ncbi:MAG: hypothetical protein Q8M15_08345 [Bacteroidota bacterium]|nr:hypothetical protein [Bacteroidota bacterium]
MKSESEINKIKASIPSILAHIYFFFNKVGLPFGLLYMHILSPVFYIWLLYKKKKTIFLPFLLILIPFSLIHLLLGVETKSFIISNILFAATYVFTVTFYFFINIYGHLGKIFKQLLISNFIFTFIALAFFYTPYQEVFWYIKKFTKSVESLPRLAMMTYEASYYSLMFIPIAFYYLLKVFFRQNKMNTWVILLMVLLPLLLSLSVGVIAASLISFILLYSIHYEKIFINKRFFNNLVFFTFTFIVIALLLIFFYPTNPVFIRLQNIISGTDSSTNGRTFDSFLIAWHIAEEKSLWFGVGLGQIKVLGPEFVHKYIKYWGPIEVLRIPNAMAETLAMFGITGIIIRFIIIFYYFFKAKVLNNYYQTLLFFFIFIYQFTGSYLTNIVEYVVWILAFSNVFPQFNVTKK